MNKSKHIDEQAFRFCLTVELENRLSAYGAKIIEDKSRDYYKMQYAFFKVPVWNEREYKDCASVVSDTLLRLEPDFLNGSSSTYRFFYNSGRKEKRPFDGRNTFILNDDNQALGFSCGKVPVSQERPALFYKAENKLKLLDISDAWLGTGAMGIEYIDAMNSVGDFIEAHKGEKWSDLFSSSEEKYEQLYHPILEALLSELKKQCSRHSCAVPNLLKHFFGNEDYYLIALQPVNKKAKVSAYGLNGKLSLGDDYAEKLLPEQLIDISYKERADSVSNTTLQLIFDKGWVACMRLRTTDNTVSVGPRLEVDFNGSRPYKLITEEVRWK